ncbi:hypothetical protein PIB30_050100 [Stylosanthes scabra]|uniref:PB1-like domain-containing protein n=1 Tax=Stylosanthes scabra TaxID=79078 RepID=A0ABU6YHR5_9FABA|nr:hypothetical protein [Stylosanthes scabra]
MESTCPLRCTLDSAYEDNVVKCIEDEPFESGLKVGGKVEKLEEMDIDHVNFGDLVKLLETLGFMTHKRMFWLDGNAIDLEIGLNLLDGDGSVRDMYNHLLMNIDASKELHIYVEHLVDVPVPAPEAALAIATASAAPPAPAAPPAAAPSPTPAPAPRGLNQETFVLSESF